MKLTKEELKVKTLKLLANLKAISDDAYNDRGDAEEYQDYDEAEFCGDVVDKCGDVEHKISQYLNAKNIKTYPNPYDKEFYYSHETHRAMSRISDIEREFDEIVKNNPIVKKKEKDELVR